ncbi:MAG TPA: ROK family protein, partial [Spirochaetia bacterium]|nr:ROK family protein [Spirochaetia bacterium]
IRLSKTTVKKTVDVLASMKLIVSAGKGLSTEEGGKRPELYRFNKGYGYVISVHVTPESIMAVTTDLAADITGFRKIEVGAERDLSFILGKLAELIGGFTTAKAASGEKLIGVVIALPGLADSSAGISIYSPHYPSWGRNVPFREMLHERLGSAREVPIFIDNVNRFQAVAEQEKGEARGVTNFIIIDALNEGLGSGIVTHGELMRGTQGLSGEIGHMTINPVGGPLCICGNRGCFETMVSARRIHEMIHDARAQGVKSAFFREEVSDASAFDEVCALARAGDPLCISIIDDVAGWFVVGLGNIIMVNDPELIVIQGQYVKAGQYFLEKLREGIKRIGLPSVEKRVRIAYSQLGEERGVIGGAASVVSDYFSRRLAFRAG